MASVGDTNRQKELVSVLYSVHENLRKQYRLVSNEEEDDSNKIWNEKWKDHVANTAQLQEYSKAMHELATEIWNPRHSTTTKLSKNTNLTNNNNKKEQQEQVEDEGRQTSINCRIEWVYLKSLDYFFNKEAVKQFHDSNKKLKLLDVGSCFNPFEKYQHIFEIMAIDLCPAPGFEHAVYKCDFLQVPLVSASTTTTTTLEFESELQRSEIASHNIKDNNYKTMESLPMDYFDVVVFSFFLEYLPDPKQRLESCKKAREILKPRGVLFILKPDSNPVTQTGMSFIKKQKVGMALLGFQRIYFQKLTHVWCTAYVKLAESERQCFINSPRVQNDLKKVNSNGTLEHHELFVISQDFKHISLGSGQENKECEIESTSSIVDKNSESDVLLFDELPLYI